MRFTLVSCLMLIVFFSLTPVCGKTESRGSSENCLAHVGSSSQGVEDFFDLSQFGAVGDGVTDDGPALQNALNAIAAAGGGTLFAPAGRYAINTPVQKDFSGLASALTILGVESLTPVPPANSTGNLLSLNPIDDARFFVRQQYRDFLNRRADAAGLDFWSTQITSCGPDANCIADRRMNVSAAFFLSIEFQETGFLVYRLYKSAYAEPPQHLNEFLLDTRTIGQGVVVNAPGWQELLEINKAEFIADFVARPRFSQAYPLDLAPSDFVDQLNSTAGDALSANEIQTAIAEFADAATSRDAGARARVLRRVAESQMLSQRELNPAFVLMQYFGYLQRNPAEAPDDNLDGYNFWLQKLNEFGGDFRRAEMVKSFLVSTEYRARFGAP